MIRLFSIPAMLLLLAGCAGTGKQVTTEDNELEHLVTLMTGSFSSTAQAEADSNFFDIRLEMKPIWQDKIQKSDGIYLYVEQAAAWTLDRPYRQRVYHVTDLGDGVFSSMVYSLPDPEAAIGAWRQDNPLSDIGPADLTEREGCAVYLKKQADGSFAGSTREKECTSTLRGATYATSKITILGDRIVSWDQGWNDADEQVWGAEISGYIFLRTAPSK